jgi:hypothetical protein
MAARDLMDIDDIRLNNDTTNSVLGEGGGDF